VLARTHGLSGGMTYPGQRDLLAALQSTRSRAGQALHQRADEGIRAADQMAPHDNAGLIGKLGPAHLSVADTLNCAPASA
jgi:hypothetical protein